MPVFRAFAAIPAIACCLCAAQAPAAPVAIDVRIAGAPLAGAVVSLEGGAMPPARIGGPYVMEQRDIMFQPPVLIVPAGATVTFPNRDKVRHHVYSFAKAKRFDLKLYGREEQRSVLFDKPGAVAIGCNIHDAMNATIVVVRSPFAAQTDRAGHVGFAGVPAGTANLRIWHPSIRAPDNSLVIAVAIPAAGLTKSVALQR
jgi:plastocyanin